MFVTFHFFLYNIGIASSCALHYEKQLSKFTAHRENYNLIKYIRRTMCFALSLLIQNAAETADELFLARIHPLVAQFTFFFNNILNFRDS